MSLDTCVVRCCPLSPIFVAAVVDNTELVMCLVVAVSAERCGGHLRRCCAVSVDETTGLRQWQRLQTDGGPVTGV